MAKTAAERQREKRKRRSAGRGVLPVECNLGAVADWLVEKNLLKGWDSDDPRAIAAALAVALDQLSDI